MTPDLQRLCDVVDQYLSVSFPENVPYLWACRLQRALDLATGTTHQDFSREAKDAVNLHGWGLR